MTRQTKPRSNRVGKIIFRLMAPAAATVLFTAFDARADGNWPAFRGPGASGNGDGSNPPAVWDVETGRNIKWRTPIPGLGHSSPIVWGERVYVTSAVSDNPEPTLRIGLYGESPEHPEDIVHDYNLYCLDSKTGKLLWTRTATRGVPKVKRHVKSSHATCTPATDGRHVLAFFGSEGLYCFDMEGELRWKKDFGLLDAGAFDAPQYQWGFGSSPTICEDRVIVQCDANNTSFIAALNIETGEELWRTARGDVPTWSTPTIVRHGDRVSAVVNGWKRIAGYDVRTGAELWRMSGGGDIPVPTPVFAHGLIFITNAHGGSSPIYAIKAGATGDISLQAGDSANDFIAWSEPRKGAYIPTPLVYGEYLHINNDRGILTCYNAQTGEQAYRVRLAEQNEAYSASPVAADGRLYFTAEPGVIHVVKAGPIFEKLETNEIGEPCLATPAITAGMLIVRTSKHVWGIAE